LTGRLAPPLPHVLLGALCAGIAAANIGRVSRPGLAVLAVVAGLAAAASTDAVQRAGLVAVALGLAGWWWGSARLEAIDRSPLSAELGRAARSRVVVTGPARRTRFEVRVPGRIVRFGQLAVVEPIMLELPHGRSPPQGAVVEVLGVLAKPNGPQNGFDERSWLRRHGIHVVLRGDRWRVVGHRGGIGGLADRVREYVAASLATGAEGERKALLAGVVLGEDEGLSEELRDRFRASGLYHLLAVSGQNVALVAGGVLLAGWVLGIPRLVAEVGALAAIAAYVLAVGAQPSVVRAGIAGALTSLAWICARERDRWWFLLLGGLALLAWSPYNLLDPGFQLSFAAVAAIFVLAPRIERALEGYPLPHPAAAFLAISTACGLATAPILWFQFHSVPILAVPANALAAPVVAPLLGLALAAAALHPVAPSAAVALVWLDGWLAAYIAFCARLVGGLPFAQLRSGAAAATIAIAAALVATYAWRRWRRAS
jgi:competence protein ComEC